MNTIYAEYNMYHNSIDIYTSAGYMLRIYDFQSLMRQPLQTIDKLNQIKYIFLNLLIQSLWRIQLIHTQKHDNIEWTPKNALYIFSRSNLPNRAKPPVRNVKCVKMGRFPLWNFKLYWIRVSVNKFALPRK